MHHPSINTAAPCFVALAVALLALCANAHPDRWVNEYATNCTAHPTRGYANHRDPIPDPAVQFTLEDSTGKALGPADSVFPGATYTLKVGYAAPSYCLVTATSGNMSAADPQDKLHCTNRFIVTDDVAQTLSASTMITLPCFEAMPDGQLVIETTHAYNPFDAYRQASVTFPADASKGVGSCAASLAATPSIALSPPSPSGSSTTANGTAVVSPVSAAMFKTVMDTKSAYVVDVRTVSKYKAGHIEGAVNIPYYNFDKKGKVDKTVAKLPTDKVLMVYSSSGRIAMRVANETIATGKIPSGSIIYTLADGIASWPAAGYNMTKK